MKNIKIKLGYKSYNISCKEDEEEYTLDLVKTLNEKLKNIEKKIKVNVENSVLFMLLLLELQDENTKMKNKVEDNTLHKDRLEKTFLNIKELHTNFADFSNEMKSKKIENSIKKNNK